MKRLGLIVMLGACGAKASPSTVDNHSTVPGGPAPMVAWTQSDGFHTERLPAMSTDGAQIVYAHQGEDGARGFPNLTLFVKDRADQVASSSVVLAIDENGEDPEAMAPSQAALDEGNNFLAAGQWNALATTEIEPSDPEQGQYFSEFNTAVAGALAIKLDTGGHVTVSDGGKVVHESDHPDWLVKDYAIDEEMTCSNPAFLQSAWVDAAHRTALLRVGYTGNDTCWEPDSEEHVLTW